MVDKKAQTTTDVSRAIAVAFCVVSVIACLGYAWFRDEMPDWWRGHGGGIPYVVFWIAFWFAVFPYRRCVAPICLFAVSFTCLLEVLQLWQPDWLTRIRSTGFGAALLGSGFDWNDFVPYFVGGAVGYVALTMACRIGQTPKQS